MTLKFKFEDFPSYAGTQCQIAALSASKAQSIFDEWFKEHKVVYCQGSLQRAWYYDNKPKPEDIYQAYLVGVTEIKKGDIMSEKLARLNKIEQQLHKIDFGSWTKVPEDTRNKWVSCDDLQWCISELKKVWEKEALIIPKGIDL